MSTDKLADEYDPTDDGVRPIKEKKPHYADKSGGHGARHQVAQQQRAEKSDERKRSRG